MVLNINKNSGGKVFKTTLLVHGVLLQKYSEKALQSKHIETP